MFATMKGVASGMIQQQIDEMLSQVDLEPKRKVQAFALSGGMKRKLSCGIALIGGSQTVFLDEPSSGNLSPSVVRRVAFI